MQTSEFTPSDSNLNDILLAQYDIRLSPHDILAFGKHDIISVPSYAKHISSTAGGYHTEGISPVPQGTDIIEKRQVSVETCRFSWNEQRESITRKRNFVALSRTQAFSLSVFADPLPQNKKIVPRKTGYDFFGLTPRKCKHLNLRHLIRI